MHSPWFVFIFFLTFADSLRPIDSSSVICTETTPLTFSLCGFSKAPLCAHDSTIDSWCYSQHANLPFKLSQGMCSKPEHVLFFSYIKRPKWRREPIFFPQHTWIPDVQCRCTNRKVASMLPWKPIVVQLDNASADKAYDMVLGPRTLEPVFITWEYF